MGTEGLKIVIGADISAVTDGMKVATSGIDQFGTKAEKTFQAVAAKVEVAAKSFDHAFDEIAASKAAMDRVSASIDEAADAAIKAGPKIESLGSRFPLSNINHFRINFQKLKADLASGFSPIIHKELSNISLGAAQAGASLNRLKPGANQAALALSNVGRVAQDLPFGFLGIQNNLNPLLESFQRLKAETGSSKEALKALGSSLIGAGGIGLALSVVSSAFLIFQNGIGGFGKKAKEAKEAADELAKSIRSIASIQGEAAASVEGQLSQVNALALAITDSNKPYAERKRALEELKEINKSYFGDLKLEDAATGALTKTVQEYTNALINSAIQKQFVDEIAKVAKAVVDSDEVIKKSRDKAGRAARETNRIEALLAETRKGPQGLQTGLSDTRVLRARQDQVRAEKELAAAGEKSTKLLEQQAIIRDNLNKAVAQGLKFKSLDDPKKTKTENDGLNKQLELLEKIRDERSANLGKLFFLDEIEDATDNLAKLEQQIGNLKLQIALRDAKKAKLPAAEIEKLKESIKANTEKALSALFLKEALLLEGSPKLKFTQPIKVEIPSNINFFKTITGGSDFNISDAVSKAVGLDKKIPVITLREAKIKFNGIKIVESEELVAKLKQDVENSINSALANVQIEAFAGLGDALGKALAGSGTSGILDGFLTLLADGLIQVGKALINYGIALKGFQIALKSLNPTTALIAGVAAIAAGSLVKASIPKFAEGGIVSGPMIGQVGERFRPEVILPLDRLPQLFKQFGGDSGGGMQLIPIINNEGLYLAMKRGEGRVGRKF